MALKLGIGGKEREGLEWIITDVGTTPASGRDSFIATPISRDEQGRPLIAPGGTISPEDVETFTTRRWSMREIEAAVRRDERNFSDTIKDVIIETYKKNATEENTTKRRSRRITWEE